MKENQPLEIVRQFDGHKVRVTGTPNHPLFVAADVCAVLELTNPSKALESLDEDEKGLTLSDTPGGQQQMLCVTESGLYHLIFKSRKEAAKRFRRWVTEEVLPAIRRDGIYLPEGLPPEGVKERARNVSTEILHLVDALIKRGVPATSASGCASNAFRDAVRIPSPITTTPQQQTPSTELKTV